MAQKKITDLQLRSSVTDDVNIPIDDTIQTYRITAPQLFAYMRLKFGGVQTIAAAGTVLDSTAVVVLLDPTSLSFVQALPAVASLPLNMVIIFKNIAVNGNTATLDGDSSETIDKVTTLVLNSLDSVEVFNTGTEWLIL